MLKSLPQIAGRLDQITRRLEADAQKGATAFGKRVFDLYRANEESITGIGKGLLDLYRGWPRHPGSGRSLQLEEISPWYAASEAVDRQVYRKNPQVLEAFLRDWVQLKRVRPEEVEALWELVHKRNAEPIDPDLWDADKALAYLREEVPKRANKIRKARRLEDEARGSYRIDFRKLFPRYYRQGHKRSVKSLPADNSTPVFRDKEEEASFLKAARRFLPRRRHDVLQLHLQGLNDEEIASKLGIAQSTVRAHRRATRQNPALKALIRRWFDIG